MQDQPPELKKSGLIHFIEVAAMVVAFAIVGYLRHR
jgi:hypothetical protein